MARRFSAVFLVCVMAAGSSVRAEDALWWHVYFSNPGRSSARAGRTDPEQALAGLIRRCRLSFDAAFYELSSPVIAEALLDAHGRGVRIRLVVEHDTVASAETQRLVAAGIPVVADENPGLMHNKFAIIDGYILWTGSYNPTPRGVSRHDNNALAVESRELADIFLAEFLEMFDDRTFGNARDRGAFAPLRLRHSVTVGSARISVFFSPEDGVERRICERLRRAKRSVRFLAFSFTSTAIAGEMAACARRGVSVSGVVERDGAAAWYSQYVRMRVEGIDVKLDTNDDGYMHHKVIIIDDETVIVGSYNFTANAARNNDENLLFIDDPGIAAEYSAEFLRIYGSAAY